MRFVEQQKTGLILQNREGRSRSSAGKDEYIFLDRKIKDHTDVCKAKKNGKYTIVSDSKYDG